MRILLIAVLLTGCTANNPNAIQDPGPDMVQTGDMGGPVVQPDMLEQASPDLLLPADGDVVNTPDMLQTPDLMPPSPDMMVQCSGGFLLCNGVCINPQNDSNNCGSCGIVCGASAVCEGMLCVSMHTHHDTFCSNTWMDTFVSVDPSNPNTAKAACDACCLTTTGTACTCTPSTLIDTNNNPVAYFYNFIKSTSGVVDKYRFYYIDNTTANLVGKADRLNSTAGVINTDYWKQ